MNETYTWSGLLIMVAVCLVLYLLYRRYPNRFWKTVFKKFTFAAVGIALLLLLSHFSQPLPIEVPPAFEEDPCIRLTANDAPYRCGASEITFAVSVTDPAVTYVAGDDWLLERYTDGQWTQYSICGDINSIAYLWQDGSTMTHKIDSIRDPGHYRLCKAVEYQDGRLNRIYPHSSGELTLYCYFEVQ